MLYQQAPIVPPTGSTTMAVAVVIASYDMPALPSASAVAVAAGQVWAVGDDSPYLYALDPNAPHQLVGQPLPLGQAHVPPGVRIPKPLKPDYECMAALPGAQRWAQLWAAVLPNLPHGHAPVTEAVFVLGSGSVRPQREVGWAAVWAGEPQPHVLSLSPHTLYAQGKAALAQHGVNTPNYEALLLGPSHAMLVHRGTAGEPSLALVWPLAGWLPQVLLAAAPAPEPQCIALPCPTGAGVSGGVWLASGQCLLCASAEDTANAYDDGAVLGSYIGHWNPHSTQAIGWAAITTTSGKPLAAKVEALWPQHSYTPSAGGPLWALTDPDGTTTQLLALHHPAAAD